MEYTWNAVVGGELICFVAVNGDRVHAEGAGREENPLYHLEGPLKGAYKWCSSLLILKIHQTSLNMGKYLKTFVIFLKLRTHCK